MKPQFCPYIYRDRDHLYLEFDKMVLRFAFSEAGLHKALRHIPNVASQPGFLSGGRNIPDKPSANGHIARKNPPAKVSKKTAHQRELKALLTDDMRQSARDLLRKLRGGNQ